MRFIAMFITAVCVFFSYQATMAKEKDYLNNKQLWLKGREVAGGGGLQPPQPLHWICLC